MKVKTFTRWEMSELEQFLIRDGETIRVRFITEYDFFIRIYFDDIVQQQWYSGQQGYGQQIPSQQPYPFGNTTQYNSQITPQSLHMSNDRNETLNSRDNTTRSVLSPFIFRNLRRGGWDV